MTGIGFQGLKKKKDNKMQSITKTVYVGSEKVEFPRLTLKDLFGVSDEILAEREKIAKELAAEQKVSQYDLVNMLMQLRQHKPSVNDIAATCDSPQGAYRVVTRSLAKGNVSPDMAEKTIREMGILDILQLAVDLVMDVQEQPKKDEKDDKKEGQTESPLSVNPSTSQNTLLAKAVGYGDPLPTQPTK